MYLKSLVVPVFLLLATPSLAQVPVTTQHYDLNRSGVNPNETILNTSNVNVNSFGKLYSLAVDAQIYSQPLYVPGVIIPGQGVHNVIYVCTENNSVYAFDADSAAETTPLWQVNLGPAILSTVISATRNIQPQIGITSTPTIDLTSDATTNTMYVVAETYENSTAIFRLHALDITTGAEKFNGPVVIQGSVPGNSSDAVGGVLTFSAFDQWQRAGLLYSNGTVFIGFGSHLDYMPFHGWVFAYNASTLTRNAVICTTPNSWGGGVWQGGAGLAFDSAAGYLYLDTGNGTFDANTGGGDYADTILKLNTSLGIVDYFTPSVQAALGSDDGDLGSAPALLLPGTTLGIGLGKGGTVYLFNRSNLGQYNPNGDQVVQEWAATYDYVTTGADGGFFAGPVFYNSTLYVWGRRDTLKAFAFNGSTFNTVPIAGPVTLVDGYSNEPAMSVSADGTTAGTGILWAAYSTNGDSDNGGPNPGILQAIDPSSLNELWDSNQNQTRDYSGSWAKWSAPTIANGKVYLATFDNVLNVYGLLSNTGGHLVGAGVSSSAAVNLTTEGTVDWEHWGDNNLNRKAGVTPQLSTYSVVGSGSVNSYSNDPRPISWSDGTPTASSSSDTDGIYIAGVGEGVSFTAPADTTSRTLVVHLGGWDSGGTFTAHLSDGSAQDFIDVTATASGQFDRNYTLSYSAASAGQTLKVTWAMATGTGNVTLNAAALASNTGSVTATEGTPQSASINSAFTTPLQVTVTNAAGSPVNNATVTFTAPSSGASGTFPGSVLTATSTTNSSGVAAAPTFTANSTVGTYSVTASVSGILISASFSLTNTAGPPSSIAATLGTPQSATVSTTFATALQATVKDALGNPVNNVTVTFTAPSSGAGATFPGSALTATAATNASGVATAPALTANSTTGAYSVTASVSGVSASASFSLTNTAAVSGAGSLTGSGTSVASAVNLTTEGTADWEHWGDTSLNRKAGVTAQLTSYTLVENGAANSYANDLRPISWTDGTPTASSSNNLNGVYTAGVGQGFSFTAPADTTSRTLVVHVGGWLSGGTFTAHLSDGSAANYTDTTATATGQFDRNYTLTYNAASASQTLTITWTMATGTGNVTLNAAALASNTGTITATAGTPQSATINNAFANPLQVTVTNASGSPVNSATVTFTAPSSGASGTFPGSVLTATSTTNSSGVAAAPTFTANSTAGAYSVVASTSGILSTAVFSLTNTAGLPASIAATVGTPQSATVSTAFATALQATVKDGSGNPVNNVTVTFTAPSSGAGATFPGSALTAAATTNTNGIATAPTLTANSTAGAYSVTASVSGVSGSVSFNLTNTPSVVGAGSLTGSGTSVASAVNLTTEGTTDWEHWGDSSLNRKAGVTAQLTTYTKVSNGNVFAYSNDPRPISWTDGTPTASSSNNLDGLYISGVGQGFSFTAPAGTTSHTLVVHVGGWNSGGTLTAHLSDGSAANYTDTTATASGQFDRNYTLTYNAASASQTLTVTWTMTTGTGNVTLNAAALQ